MGFDTVGKVPPRVDHEGLDVLGCHAVAVALRTDVDWLYHVLPPCAAMAASIAARKFLCLR